MSRDLMTVGSAAGIGRRRVSAISKLSIGPGKEMKT